MKKSDANEESTQILKPKQQTSKIPARFQASVVIIEGYPEGMEYLIEKEYTVIGRDKSTADIALKDPLVSRQHVAVLFRDGNYTLKDLESTNGTLMNGARIQQADLRHGAKFRVGDTTLQFILQDTGAAKVYEIS